MNKRIFRKLQLPGGCIQDTKDLENYIGASQQTAPSQEEEEEEEEHSKEGAVGRQWASEATSSAARYRELKPANICLDSIDLQM